MQRIALLESEKHAGKAGAGSAASIALHVVVLAFAIAVTSRAGSHDGRRDAVYVPLPRWQPQVRMVSQPKTTSAQSLIPHVPVLAIAAPTVVPTTISAPSFVNPVAASVGAAVTSVPGSQVGRDTAATTPRGDSPFGIEEVDVAAQTIGGQRGPNYPESLRAIGIEGRVVARFIIGKNGRVESDPTIVSATADEFAASVKRYLAGARYRPATKNGEPVRQLAEQEFDFSVRH